MSSPVALGLRSAAKPARYLKNAALNTSFSGSASTAKRVGQVTQQPRRCANTAVRASDEDRSKVNYNQEFGYSRKDVILIGVGLIGGGFFCKWALEAGGVDPIMAGNYAQLIIFVGLCFGWIGSYLFRVATKQMTYAKQLEDYEEAVMQKRLEEMPEAEIESMMADIEEEKQRRGGSSSN